MDYIHINPVKHELVPRVRDRSYSSFHRMVKLGVYPEDWAGDVSHDGASFGERRSAARPSDGFRKSSTILPAVVVSKLCSAGWTDVEGSTPVRIISRFIEFRGPTYRASVFLIEHGNNPDLKDIRGPLDRGIFNEQRSQTNHRHRPTLMRRPGIPGPTSTPWNTGYSLSRAVTVECESPPCPRAIAEASRKRYAASVSGVFDSALASAVEAT
jgi:hypothetical protein